MNVAYNNAGSGSGIFAPTPRRLGCPVEKVNPDRYMFAQHVTSLSGPVAAMPSGEMEASSAFYKRELPGRPRNPQPGLMTPNQDDGLAYYFPNTGYDGALNEQAEVFHAQVSPWMHMSSTKLLHARALKRPSGGGGGGTFSTRPASPISGTITPGPRDGTVAISTS